MWSEIKGSASENNDKLAFEFFFEEKVWQMVSMIDQFDLKTISKEVISKIEAKFLSDNTLSYEIIDYIYALWSVLK